QQKEHRELQWTDGRPNVDRDSIRDHWGSDRQRDELRGPWGRKELWADGDASGRQPRVWNELREQWDERKLGVDRRKHEWVERHRKDNRGESLCGGRRHAGH